MTNHNSLKVSVIQLCSRDDVEENLQKINSMSEAAVLQQKMIGADGNPINLLPGTSGMSSRSNASLHLIALPENCFFYGGKLDEKVVERIDRAQLALQRFAKAQGVSFLIGSMPVKSQTAGKFYARSVLINNNGELNACYDKRHLFDVNVNDGHGVYRESDTYLAGNEVVVSKIPGSQFSLGFWICFDLRFADHFRQLRALGANLISVPSAFTKVTGEAHWEVLLRARAIETQSYIIAPNQVGDHGAGRKTWGHSMIVDPWGRVIRSLDAEPGFCSAEIDIEFVNKLRNDMPLKV